MFTIKYDQGTSLPGSEHATLQEALAAVTAQFASLQFDVATGGDDHFTLCFVHIPGAEYTTVLARIYRTSAEAITDEAPHSRVLAQRLKTA